MGTTEFTKNKLHLQFIKSLDVEKCKKENCRTFGNEKGCKPKPGIVCGTNKVNDELKKIAETTDISERLKKLVAYYNKHRTKYFLACLENKCSLMDCVTGCHNEDELIHFHSHIWGLHYNAIREVAKEQIVNLDWCEEIKSFENLYDYLKKKLGNDNENHVKGYGPLSLYDTAIRIGYHAVKDGKLHRIMPKDFVYLQAGALTGATNLQKSRTIDLGPGYPKKIQTKVLLDAVPELKGLKEEKGVYTKALLIEDFFCVFEDYLEEAAKK